MRDAIVPVRGARPPFFPHQIDDGASLELRRRARSQLASSRSTHLRRSLPSDVSTPVSLAPFDFPPPLRFVISPPFTSAFTSVDRTDGSRFALPRGCLLANFRSFLYNAVSVVVVFFVLSEKADLGT